MGPSISQCENLASRHRRKRIPDRCRLPIIGCIGINTVAVPEYAALYRQHPEQSAVVFHRLMVNAEFQGRGNIRRNMNAIGEIALESGAHSVRLDAFLHNPAAFWLYDAPGYSRVGMVLSEGAVCLL